MAFPVVGVVGGGQLARMMAGPAIELGITLRVLARDGADSAAQVVPGTEIGDETDLEALRRFAKGCDGRQKTCSAQPAWSEILWKCFDPGETFRDAWRSAPTGRSGLTCTQTAAKRKSSGANCAKRNSAESDGSKTLDDAGPRGITTATSGWRANAQANS